MIVDGGPVGNVTYNFFRPDVSNTFPGLANSSGPVGYRTIDTTALAEGLHTISWTATDTRPATSGLGSRYFNVANSADAQPSGGGSVTASEEQVADAAKPIGVVARPTGSSCRESCSVIPSGGGHETGRGRRARSARRRTEAPFADERRRPGMLTLAPMERIELTLGATDQMCPATWAGYLLKDGVLGDLPVGTSLDASGTFYWQTGPGFAGRFPLLFVRTDCRGDKATASGPRHDCQWLTSIDRCFDRRRPRGSRVRPTRRSPWSRCRRTRIGRRWLPLRRAGPRHEWHGSLAAVGKARRRSVQASSPFATFVKCRCQPIRSGLSNPDAWEAPSVEGSPLVISPAGQQANERSESAANGAGPRGPASGRVRGLGRELPSIQ